MVVQWLHLSVMGPESTIINLLPRFYDPQNGNIFIDQARSQI